MLSNSCPTLTENQLKALIELDNAYFEKKSKRPNKLNEGPLSINQNLNNSQAVSDMLKARYGYNITKKRFYKKKEIDPPEVSKEDAYGSPFFHYLKREYRRLTNDEEAANKAIPTSSIVKKKWKVDLSEILSCMKDLGETIGSYIDDVFAALQVQGVLSSMAQVNERLGGIHASFSFLNVLFGIYEIYVAVTKKMKTTLTTEDQDNVRNAKVGSAIGKIILGVGTVITAAFFAAIAFVTVPAVLFVFAVYQQISSIVEFARDKFVDWKLQKNLHVKRDDLKKFENGFDDFVSKHLPSKQNDNNNDNTSPNVDKKVVPVESSTNNTDIDHENATPTPKGKLIWNKECIDQLDKMSKQKLITKKAKRESEIATLDMRFSAISFFSSTLGVVATGAGFVLSILALLSISVFAPWVPALLLTIGITATVLGLGARFFQVFDKAVGYRVTDWFHDKLPFLKVKDTSKKDIKEDIKKDISNKNQSWARIKQMLEMGEVKKKIEDEKTPNVYLDQGQDKVFSVTKDKKPENSKQVLGPIETESCEKNKPMRQRAQSLPNLSSIYFMANQDVKTEKGPYHHPEKFKVNNL